MLETIRQICSFHHRQQRSSANGKRGGIFHYCPERISRTPIIEQFRECASVNRTVRRVVGMNLKVIGFAIGAYLIGVILGALLFVRAA